MSSPTVVVTSRVFEDTLRTLSACGVVIANDTAEPWPRERLLSLARGASALMAFMPDTVDADFLDACPNLQIVACALKGFNNFDVDACTKRGVWLTIVPDLLTDPTAELAIGLMIAQSRNVLAGDDLVRSGNHRGWRPVLYGKSIDASVVGILGGGAVGHAIARKLSGFQCETLLSDPAPRGVLPGNARWASAEEVTSRADYFVLAVPLQPSTLGMVNKAFIARLKRGAIIVNVARGSLVDEADVADALREGHLGGYAADVYAFEDQAVQPRSTHVEASLRELRDRTLLTPHLGSAVESVRREIERDAALNIVEALAGNRPHGAINAVTARRR